MSAEEQTALERAQQIIREGGADASIRWSLLSIAESLAAMVGIPPCPHCGSRAGAAPWDAEMADDDPSVWHRRCAACGGRLPELEP